MSNFGFLQTEWLDVFESVGMAEVSCVKEIRAVLLANADTGNAAATPSTQPSPASPGAKP